MRRGVGWSAEEFAALGVPFAGRGRRTEEYLAAMRAVWAEDPASFTGEFTRFDAIRVNPKPLRDGRLPVVVGGNSDAALHRAATLVDGWYGFNVPAADVPARVAVLADTCARHGRAQSSLGSPAARPRAEEDTEPASARIRDRNTVSRGRDAVTQTCRPLPEGIGHLGTDVRGRPSAGSSEDLHIGPAHLCGRLGDQDLCLFPGAHRHVSRSVALLLPTPEYPFSHAPPRVKVLTFGRPR
ncbi:LLM class flavin-dependent oxidoreductase [Streptomyces sp. LN499]|uniref:LLM class flavin-dependent oxidoreductase n=1 Tax=Streptomyces sp. LN499 TaxID=3112977 RepID=UPI00371C3C38